MEVNAHGKDHPSSADTLFFSIEFYIKPTHMPSCKVQFLIKILFISYILLVAVFLLPAILLSITTTTLLLLVQEG